MDDKAKARLEVAVKTMVAIILEAVKECKAPFGLPGGHLYALLMTAGIRLDTFNAIMDALITTGQVVKKHDCFLPGPNLK